MSDDDDIGVDLFASGELTQTYNHNHKQTSVKPVEHDDRRKELQQLKELRKSGFISREEYKRRRQLLGVTKDSDCDTELEQGLRLGGFGVGFDEPSTTIASYHSPVSYSNDTFGNIEHHHQMALVDSISVSDYNSDLHESENSGEKALQALAQINEMLEMGYITEDEWQKKRDKLFAALNSTEISTESMNEFIAEFHASQALVESNEPSPIQPSQEKEGFSNSYEEYALGDHASDDESGDVMVRKLYISFIEPHSKTEMAARGNYFSVLADSDQEESQSEGEPEIDEELERFQHPSGSYAKLQEEEEREKERQKQLKEQMKIDKIIEALAFRIPEGFMTPIGNPNSATKGWVQVLIVLRQLSDSQSVLSLSPSLMEIPVGVTIRGSNVTLTGKPLDVEVAANKINAVIASRCDEQIELASYQLRLLEQRQPQIQHIATKTKTTISLSSDSPQTKFGGYESSDSDSDSDGNNSDDYGRVVKRRMVSGNDGRFVKMTGTQFAIRRAKDRIVSLLKSFNFRKYPLGQTYVTVGYANHGYQNGEYRYSPNGSKEYSEHCLRNWGQEKKKIEEASQTVIVDDVDPKLPSWRYMGRSFMDIIIYGTVKSINLAESLIESYKSRYIRELIHFPELESASDVALLLIPQLEFARRKSGSQQLTLSNSSVLVVGTEKQIDLAKTLVGDIVKRFCAIIIEVMPLPSLKMAVGLFGKGGVRINSIKETSKCLLLKIDTKAITLTMKALQPEHIESAKKLVNEKMKEIEAEDKKNRFIMKLQRAKERGKGGRGGGRGGAVASRGGSARGGASVTGRRPV